MNKSYSIYPHRDKNGVLVDIEIEQDGRRIAMLGPGGARRELSLLTSGSGEEGVPDFARKLPVLLGSGMGHALRELLQRTDGPVAVVDKERPLLEITELKKQSDISRVQWIEDEDPQTALTRLTRWQEEHGGKPLFPVMNLFYQRLDRQWYQTILERVKASAIFDFWGKAVRPRFTGSLPRILLVTSKYFLIGEVERACKRLGIPYHLLTIADKEIGGTEFVEQLLKAVVTFHPDCIFTMNHMGVDREGVLTALLEKLQLPLASWFVDNPQLILHSYRGLASPWTVIFTWDRDNIPLLNRQGYKHAFYIPLGTDPQRFRPRQVKATFRSPLFPTSVSFVGNSMVYKVGGRLRAGHFSRDLLIGYRQIAADYSGAQERSMRHFLLEYAPRVKSAYEALPSDEDRLAYETMLTWEATRQYRSRCVQHILPFSPVLVGDKGWRHTLKSDLNWHLHSEVSYYEDLPDVYLSSAINFNCTSKQMKGAVNQRIFDVPATGSFVLTDWREQLEELFVPGKEVICYREPEEIQELVRYYLTHPHERRKIATAARHRVLGEHTWDHRVTAMMGHLKSLYG